MKRALILIFFFATLIGCDSNSGAIAPGGEPPPTGGQPPPPPPPPPPGTGITSANAGAISGSTWDAVNNSAAMVGLIGNSGLIASNPAGLNKVAQNIAAKASLGELVQGALVTFPPLDCVIPGGTYTVSFDILDPLTLTPNDVINVDYDNCDDDVGEVLDGLTEMTIISFTGDIFVGPWDLTASLRLTNFQVTTAADTILTTGTAIVSLNALDPMNVSASVAGASMITDTNTYSETLTDFQTAQTVDTVAATLPYTIAASGTLDNSQLSGVIDYNTDPLSPFTGFGLDFPSSGVLFINEVGSSARLTVVDNIDVIIDIDNDGDGSYDEMINTTWVAITTPP